MLVCHRNINKCKISLCCLWPSRYWLSVSQLRWATSQLLAVYLAQILVFQCLEEQWYVKCREYALSNIRWVLSNLVLHKYFQIRTKIVLFPGFTVFLKVKATDNCLLPHKTHFVVPSELFPPLNSLSFIMRARFIIWTERRLCACQLRMRCPRMTISGLSFWEKF